MDLTEAEDIKKRWQEYTEKLYKKELHDPDNHDGVITHLQPVILECEVKWVLGRSISTNKASGGDGIPVELFQILKDNAVKVLHSICQHTWKTQQWPQDWKRSVFIPIPKKDKLLHNCILSHVSSHVQLFVAPGILQARILEWVAFPFSRGSSQHRNRTHVSCNAGRFFTAEPPGKPFYPYRHYSNLFW